MLTVLVGVSVICWMKLELEVLQRIENIVWRTMLSAPGYAPVRKLTHAHCRVRLEPPETGVVAKDIKQKLSYQKYLIDCDNDLLMKFMTSSIRLSVNQIPTSGSSVSVLCLSPPLQRLQPQTAVWELGHNQEYLA